MKTHKESANIYLLQNPVTNEIFYIGATTKNINERLSNHYKHLKECDNGKRRNNKRFDYLRELLPVKAKAILIESVAIDMLDDKEIYYIEVFKNAGHKLTNMTDGGTGQHTSKYYTESQMDEYSEKISKANKGRKKPDGFAENLSKIRTGVGNTRAKELSPWIYCIKEGSIEMVFKYLFQMNDFFNSKYANSNYIMYKKGRLKSCYGRQFKCFDELNEEDKSELLDKHNEFYGK